MSRLEGSLHRLKADASARADDEDCRHGIMLLVGPARLSVMCDVGSHSARWAVGAPSVAATVGSGFAAARWPGARSYAVAARCRAIAPPSQLRRSLRETREQSTQMRCASHGRLCGYRGLTPLGPTCCTDAAIARRSAATAGYFPASSSRLPISTSAGTTPGHSVLAPKNQ
jgi:hypothetical protein